MVNEIDRINRAGVTLKIVLLSALLILFNFVPEYFGILVSAGEEVVILTPAYLGLRLPASLLNLWWMLSLVQHIFLLRNGRWTRETRWMEFGLGLYGAWILWWILRENGDFFRRGIQISGMPTRQIGHTIGRIIQLSFAIALVATLVASVRRYRALGVDHAALLTTAAARTVGGQRWGDFEKNLRRDLKDVYQFYLDDEERERLSKMGAFSRWAHLIVWVFKSMYHKLTPARRILLLVAFIISTVSIDIGAGNLNVRITGLCPTPRHSTSRAQGQAGGDRRTGGRPGGSDSHVAARESRSVGVGDLVVHPSGQRSRWRPRGLHRNGQ